MTRRECASCAEGAQLTLRSVADDMPTGTPVHVICSYGDHCTSCHRRIQDGEHYWDPVRSGAQQCNACWIKANTFHPQQAFDFDALVTGSTEPYYPDCQPVPHNPLDCRGDGPEDHDPAYSSGQACGCLHSHYDGACPESSDLPPDGAP